MFRAKHELALYEIRKSVFVLRAGNQAKARVTRMQGGLLCAPFRRARRADRQLQNTHTSKDMREGANLLYTALAACRVTLAGAAETGAGGRHVPFDPIRLLGLGDTETGTAVMQTNPADA